ncbi:hypothetical protein EC957_007602 [Mortierella hygrophila]|uniref:Uncharacterized protein n=1 Tax=Mortierella hygrophila TaxID=979708 RepID=A0A9P6FCU8_9FUNG|nr:hypothetical protein EC957_007602 [Mortierella hygrophila]
MSVALNIPTKTSHLNSLPTPKTQKTTNVWFDDPQRAILQQIKKHTMGPNGYGRIRVPARYYPPVDNGPNTIVVVKNAIGTNNPTALSHELLKFFDSTAGYRRAALYGTTNRLIIALVECLKYHTDPPMFILQALMALGEIAKTRDLDHEFERMMSQFLVDVLCSPPFLPSLDSTTPPLTDDEICYLAGDDGYDNSSTSGGTGQPFLPNGNHSSFAFATSSSTNDTNSSLSNSSTHITNTTISTSTKKTKNPRRKKKKNPTTRNDAILCDLGACVSPLDGKPLLLGFADSPLLAQDTPQNKTAVQGKPFNIMDANNDIIFFNLNDIQPFPIPPTNHQHHIYPPSSGNALSHRHLYWLKNIASQEAHSRFIQPRHHQEVLNEILAQKNPLQIFLAIDAFELDPILLTHLFNANHHHDLLLDDNNSNYGSLLMIQLIEQGYPEEAASLALRFPLCRSNGIDKKLVARLIETNKLGLIHELIGDNKDLGRSTLHSIDRRMAAQIWNWVEEGIIELDQLDPFYAVQCMNEGAQAKVIRSDDDCAATLIQLVGLTESTTNLSVKFGLDNTMKALQSLKFVTDLCTVISFLRQQEQQADSLKTLASSPPEPISTMVDGPSSSSRCSEYQLTRSWKFFPAIMQILKNDVTMQRLVIWYGVRTLRDSKTTCFLASKLGQRVYLDRCFEQVKVQ